MQKLAAALAASVTTEEAQEARLAARYAANLRKAQEMSLAPMDVDDKGKDPMDEDDDFDDQYAGIDNNDDGVDWAKLMRDKKL